jgi:hypothetical protein
MADLRPRCPSTRLALLVLLACPARALTLGSVRSLVGSARSRASPIMVRLSAQAANDGDTLEACVPLNDNDRSQMSIVAGDDSQRSDVVFCAEPSDAPGVTCFLTPEWMASKSPDATEWVCMADETEWKLMHDKVEAEDSY